MGVFEFDMTSIAVRRLPEDDIFWPEEARASVTNLKQLKPVPVADLRIVIHQELDTIEAEWRRFETEACCFVFQTFGWLSKWQRHIGAPRGVRPAIVCGYDKSDRLLFIFPFSVETAGVVRRLSWLGHELCDYNAPLIVHDFLRTLDTAGFTTLWRSIVRRLKSECPRFDLIDLDRMPEQLGGHPNPFSGLDVIAHPSGAHVATLDSDFDSFYAAKRSSATRKKERKKLRQLGEYGEVRLVHATTPEERVEVLNTLFGQKSHWFARMGIKDIFAPAGTREFFADLASDPAMQDVVHVSKLGVGDTAAATSVGLRHSDCYYLVLSSYADAELSRLGPGRVHLHELLRDAIARGCQWFDFTVGDEAYKLDWSDLTIRLYDYLEPVSLQGRIARFSGLAFRRAKRFIKNTPILWRAYNAYRLLKARATGGGKATAEQAEPAE